MTPLDLYPNPYQPLQQEKEKFLLGKLNTLTEHHRLNCSSYQRLLSLFHPRKKSFLHLNDIPYLPVNLFKTQDLFSVSEKDLFKTLYSSGTTSAHPSKIFLDALTAQHQTMALAEIMTSFLGEKRLPMLVCDHSNVIKDRKNYSARGAAILGMLNFGRDVHYLLNEDMKPDLASLHQWLAKYQNSPILVFGLTFLIWKYLLSEIKSNAIHLPQGILIHTGGWKKMQEEAISNESFKQKVFELTGISRCHNFYGMVEQIGSVFMECENGCLHCPYFADIIIRNPKTWSECPKKTDGIIQVLSALPWSYPGHSLLTEDLGTLFGIDDCPCGRKGKYFKVIGRIAKTEIRGCSDTYGS